MNKRDDRKTTYFNLHYWTFINVYIEYKEEARHLPKTLTLELRTHKEKIIKKEEKNITFSGKK